MDQSAQISFTLNLYTHRNLNLNTNVQICSLLNFSLSGFISVQFLHLKFFLFSKHCCQTVIFRCVSEDFYFHLYSLVNFEMGVCFAVISMENKQL